jgi:hypothetical protein
VEPIAKKDDGIFSLSRRDLLKSFFIVALPFGAFETHRVFPGQVLFVGTKALPPFDAFCLRGAQEVSKVECKCLDIGFFRIVRVRIPVPQEFGDFKVVIASKDKTVFEGHMVINPFYFGL